MDNSKTRVVVAMSGGVDSSVAALVLKQQGYDVVGMALQVTDYSKYQKDDSQGTCCSLKDMEDARRIAEALDMPFYVMDTESTFDATVVDNFVESYLAGETPNPCVRCNVSVKFNHLFRRALEIGADFVATGHYAQVQKLDNYEYGLFCGADKNKDQSYFLYNLNQEQLKRTLFPIGHMQKSEVRKLADDHRLPVAFKPESYEICFVPNNDYARFIEDRVDNSRIIKGHIVEESTQTPLSAHDGVHKFTIGQRKGIGGALDKARQLKLKNTDSLFVTRIDPKTGTVFLGSKDSLYKDQLKIKNLHWISDESEKPTSFEAKIRYRSHAAPVEMTPVEDESLYALKFQENQRAVTPGQACVFYNGEQCIGGAWIA